MLNHVLPTAMGLGALLLAGCPSTAPVPTSALPPPMRPVAETIEQRAGLVLTEDPWGDGARRIAYLDQNWGPIETLWYYFADQGSVLLPYATLVNLEQAESTEKLIAPDNMARYRFLNQTRTPNNPDALPVGFAKHENDDDTVMVGLTCAACHTSQIIYDKTAIRIDGAPALIDMIGFLGGVEAAMGATLADEAKLARFVAATRGEDETADAVKAGLERDRAWFRS